MRHLKGSAIALALGTILLIGCGGSGTDGATGSPGRLTQQEVIQALGSNFSLGKDEFHAIYQALVKARPELNNSEAMLERALFDKLKTAKQPDQPEDPAKLKELLDLFDKLTAAEIALLITHPTYILPAYTAYRDARGVGAAAFPCGSGSPVPFNDDKADAVRHAYWIGLTAKRVKGHLPLVSVQSAAAFALALGLAHESNMTGSNPLQRKDMDLSNNAAGVDVYLRGPAASESEMLTQIVHLPFEYFAPGARIPLNVKRLAFFEGRQPYDGVFAGTVGNPEGGGAWSLRLSLTQCGSKIRGEWYVTRPNGQFQRRRVSGDLQGSRAVLTIQNPYAWENAGQIVQFCENMQADLTVSENSMTGHWRGTNCPNGGAINLHR